MLWQNKGNPHPYFLLESSQYAHVSQSKVDQSNCQSWDWEQKFRWISKFFVQKCVRRDSEQCWFLASLVPSHRQVFTDSIEHAQYFLHQKIDGLSQKNVTKIAVKVWVEKLLRSYKFSNRNVFQMILSNFGSWTYLSPPHLWTDFHWFHISPRAYCTSNKKAFQ